VGMNHNQRVERLHRRMEPPGLSIETLIAAWPEPDETDQIQSLPYGFTEAEECIDAHVARLPESDRAQFAGFMLGDLPEIELSSGLDQALRAELLVEMSLMVRVGETPARKRHRGWL